MRSHERYDSLIRFYAEEHGFDGTDWLWFKAQIRAESNFDPKAISPVGARGLSQFMPATWDEWAKGENPFNPESSINAQVRYMKWLLGRVTTWELAFAAYNWGVGRILKVWQDPLWKSKLPLETENYIFRINSYYREYKNGRIDS